MHPSKDEFLQLSRDYNLIPIYQEIVADMDTPVSVFKKMNEGQNAFLLESVEGAERWGRYSFIGSSPFIIVESRGDRVVIQENGEQKKIREEPLKVIAQILSRYRAYPDPDLPPFFGGAVGYLGYDMIRFFEEISARAIDDLGLLDLVFLFTDTIVVFDHLKHRIKVVANVHTAGEAEEEYEKGAQKINKIVDLLKRTISYEPVGINGARMDRAVESNLSRDQFEDMVRRAKEYIFAGDVLQVVLSQRFSVDVEVDPFDIYRVLRTLNPSPYLYFLRHNDMAVIGSSPEPLVKVVGSQVITRPIAGTRPRGATREEDLALEKELLADEKELAEHVMLVDLGRNDVGRVCVPGTVKVDEFMAVERYSHVMHLVSNVVGELRSDQTVFEALKSVFPAGTVSGAPKIRAMEIIDELEPVRRGLYAGALGNIGFTGDMDVCITIRTIIVKDGRAYVQAGAGIVADSVPAKEYEETVNKARALIQAIILAEEGLK